MPAGSYDRGDELPAGETLYRRIPPYRPDYWSRKHDRPSSLNFLPDRDETDVSMHWGRFTSPEKILGQYPGAGLCQLSTDLLRGLGLRVTYEPGPGGQDHVSVWGLKDSRESLRRNIARGLTRSWRPAGVPDPAGDR